MKDSRTKINILGLKLTVNNPFSIVNNKVILIKDNKRKRLRFVKGLKVKFYGSNNTIEFHNNIPKMDNVKIECGNNTNISIGKTQYKLKNLYINSRANNVSVKIDDDFSIESGKFDFHGEPNIEINIGKDCQFGCNINLDPADGHTIYDETTKVMLNKPKSINIGNHIWLCENVSILKGVNIPNNCVVGKNSLVTGKYTNKNSIIAGTPAKIIKSGINWSRTANKNYSTQQ